MISILNEVMLLSASMLAGVVLIYRRRPWAGWVLLLGAVSVALFLSGFHRLADPSTKGDTNLFIWVERVVMRGVTGLLVSVSSAFLGTARVAPRVLAAAGVLYGVSLIGSGLTLWRASASVVLDGASFAVVERAAHQSDVILALGVMCLAAGVVLYCVSPGVAPDIDQRGD